MWWGGGVCGCRGLLSSCRRQWGREPPSSSSRWCRRTSGCRHCWDSLSPPRLVDGGPLGHRLQTVPRWGAVRPLCLLASSPCSWPLVTRRERQGHRQKLGWGGGARTQSPLAGTLSLVSASPCCPLPARAGPDSRSASYRATAWVLCWLQQAGSPTASPSGLIGSLSVQTPKLRIAELVLCSSRIPHPEAAAASAA